MNESRLSWLDYLGFVVILALAGGLRAGYVHYCLPENGDLPIEVQDAETALRLHPAGAGGERTALMENIRDNLWFGSRAPLAEIDEETAHVSPGYPWLVACVVSYIDDTPTALAVVRWIQVGLGALTAVLLALFSRLKFGSSFVGFLSGLLAAVYPFWIVNVAELQDGALVCFLFSLCLALGTAGAIRGGPLTSLLFGLSLAGLALTRAALLPFAFVACLWYLLRCRTMARGWVCALVVFLGFANGLAPWTVRNWQVFGDLLPIIDSTYLHLWIGSNHLARGGPQDAKTLQESLPAERYKAITAEPNQARRYRMLSEDWRAAVEANPTGFVEKRMRSGTCFFFGSAWFRDYTLVRENPRVPLPAEVAEALPLGLRAMLLLILVFGLLGWRWSYGWNRESTLASLALLWIPLPYILTHAEHFSGPRLPLDGALICYTAFALTWWFPPIARIVFDEGDAEEE